MTLEGVPIHLLLRSCERRCQWPRLSGRLRAYLAAAAAAPLQTAIAGQWATRRRDSHWPYVTTGSEFVHRRQHRSYGWSPSGPAADLPHCASTRAGYAGPILALSVGARLGMTASSQAAVTVTPRKLAKKGAGPQEVGFARARSSCSARCVAGSSRGRRTRHSASCTGCILALQHHIASCGPGNSCMPAIPCAVPGSSVPQQTMMTARTHPWSEHELCDAEMEKENGEFSNHFTGWLVLGLVTERAWSGAPRGERHRHPPVVLAVSAPGLGRS